MKKKESLKKLLDRKFKKQVNNVNRSDDEEAMYIVPKMDLTYSLRDEEDKEDVINVMPSAGKIRKSNRIKKSTTC